MVLIRSVAGDETWEDVTITMLESARKKLRALVKLIERAKKNIFYTDFEDEMGDSTTIILPSFSSGLSLTKFKDKARQFLKAHEDHLSLQCLRCNQALTASDLNALGQMLVAAGSSAEVIQQATEQSQGLGIFIRSLVGLDRETAKQAFS
jgi:type I restriction enzyme R subunit